MPEPKQVILDRMKFANDKIKIANEVAWTQRLVRNADEIDVDPGRTRLQLIAGELGFGTVAGDES